MQRTLIAAVVALFGVLAGPAQAATPRATHIVQLREGVSLAEGQAAVRAAGGRVTDTLPMIDGLAVRAASAPSASQDDPRIAAVSANARIRSQSDRFDPAQLGDRLPGVGAGPAGVEHARPAPVSASRSSTPGIDGGLVDFSDAQGASRVVASVVTSPDATTPNDDYGHGTHVAGIIAGDSTRRPAGDPLARQVRRHRSGREPDRDQGLRRRRQRHDPRRDLRPPVRGRPQDRLQHPRRQPVGGVDGRRVLPDRPARRRGRGRVLQRHPRRHRGRQSRHRRGRGRLRARATTRSR